ncbi:hypothetical protein Tco_0981177, partial [Tanacetum coccineum]
TDISKITRIQSKADTRIRRVQKEAKESKPKPEKSSLSRKAHLFGDKQIPSVGVFDEVTWKTFRENTRDLGSILEEAGQEYDFTPKEGLKNKSQMVETASGYLATPSGSDSDRLRKRSGYHQKDRKPSQNDKTEHGMEKTDSKDDLHGFNNEENLNTGEDMDTDLPLTTEEETPLLNIQLSHLSRHKKSKKHKKPDASPKPSDSESSSTLLAYKGFDNYVPTTEGVLANTLQGFNELLYAQIFEALWEKNAEVATSYADLKGEINGFHDQVPSKGDILVLKPYGDWRKTPSQLGWQQPTKTEEEQSEEPIETKVPIQAIPIYTVTPTPIITTTILSKVTIPEVTPPRADKGKGYSY